MIDIRDAMTDPNLFGGTFGGDSFAAWRALLSGFYGLPLDNDEADTFKAITGRTEAPTEAHDELWLVVGRRGGKSHVAGLVAAYEAAFRDHRDKLAAGEVATVMVIAADRKQARAVMRYVRGMFEHPMLKPLVKRETENGLELTNRAEIEITTASFKAVRGYTLAAVIADEIAFWFSDGANPDAEIIAALRPALATLGGKLIAISSPYARRGVLWNAYKRHYGKAGRVLVAQAPSRTMNPGLPERVVDDAMKDDAARACAEYLAQFRSDIEAFLSVEIVDSVTRERPLELPFVEGITYTGFVDPSGGGADEMTLGIGHREGDTTVIDLVMGQRGNPAKITEEFSEVLKRYGIYKVTGDKYAGAWVVERFKDHGITYQAEAPPRSELYAALGLAARAGQLELPPCGMLGRQLVALERRTSRGGRDLIDHPP
ncbi:MAG: hypothetical protein LC676_06265, partial [Loktanella sp.]|nr:hypothetical protein [Loktanella sp.]